VEKWGGRKVPSAKTREEAVIRRSDAPGVPIDSVRQSNSESGHHPPTTTARPKAATAFVYEGKGIVADDTQGRENSSRLLCYTAKRVLNHFKESRLTEGHGHARVSRSVADLTGSVPADRATPQIDPREAFKWCWGLISHRRAATNPATIDITSVPDESETFFPEHGGVVLGHSRSRVGRKRGSRGNKDGRARAPTDETRDLPRYVEFEAAHPNDDREQYRGVQITGAAKCHSGKHQHGATRDAKSTKSAPKQCTVNAKPDGGRGKGSIGLHKKGPSG